MIKMSIYNIVCDLEPSSLEESLWYWILLLLSYVGTWTHGWSYEKSAKS